MLCPKCQSINLTSSLTVELDRDLDRWDSVPTALRPTHIGSEYYVCLHHDNLQDLYASASLGCHFCTQIRAELFHIRGHEASDLEHDGHVEIRYYPHDDKVTGDTRIREIVVVAATAVRSIKLSFDFVRFPASSSLKRISYDKALSASVSASTGCKENLELAAVWLRRCLTEHDFCTTSTTALAPLPSRVLDVDAFGSASKIALVSSEGRHGPYMTLSHVWGKERIITTTQANIEQHKKCIPLEALSQTFQNAVAIARSLNVKFLWIDSLCIVQDDRGDWFDEAVKMGSYYFNSLLNIAAVSATSGYAGCFRDYNPLTITPCPIRITFQASKTLPASSTSDLTGFTRPGSPGWDPAETTNGFQRPILWQRAWVLQERLLSPRLLLFSDTQMSWSCRSEQASERVPEGTKSFKDPEYGDDILQSAILGLKTFAKRTVSISEKGQETTSDDEDEDRLAEDQIDLYNKWYDLVMLYGKCQLTIKSDIFPAIAGIARAIGTATGDTYLAGHWKGDLHRGLLWTAPDSTRHQPDLRTYRAPSWSWASLPATCTFMVREIWQTDVSGSCLEMWGGWVENISGDDFGELKDGKLVVCGMIKRAHPRVLDLEEDVFASLKGSDRWTTLFDLNARMAIGQYYPDNDEKWLFPEIWCAPIVTEASYMPKMVDGREVPKREARCWALICLNAEKQIYQRVGFAWIKDADWFDECVKGLFTVV